MKTKNSLTIKLPDAIKLYPNASTDFKKQLEDAFGKNKLSKNIIDRIKTFDDVLAELGNKDEDVIFYKILLKLKCPVHTLNYQKLVLITKALNEGWAPNWSDKNEYKYWLYFAIEQASGGRSIRFSCSHYAYVITFTHFSGHLCYKNGELAEYSGKQFISVWELFLI